MSEKSLDDFFNEAEHIDFETRHEKNQKEKEKRKKNHKTKKNGSIKNFFRNKFSFDCDVDLTNPVSVLYRRNVVIKNIITLANLVFFIFSFVGISKSNYIITIAFWLALTALSWTIKYLLKNKKDDYHHQSLIMYCQSFFVFFLSVALYLKVWLGFYFEDGSSSFTLEQFSITQASYILIYFTIVIMSLYQNTKLLRGMFFWTFIVMTILHLTTLHPELYNNASSITSLINFAFKEHKNVSIDILLRTVVFLVFFISLYVSSLVSSYISEQRKNEYKLRVGVEADFKDVVLSVFEAVKVYNLDSDQLSSNISAKRCRNVAKIIALSMNYDSDEVSKIEDFATVHSDKMNLLNLDENESLNESNFDEVLKKTKLATVIIKRLQLHKKAEDICQSIIHNTLSLDSKYNIASKNNDTTSEIILLSEIYDILRTDRAYKMGLTHQRAIEVIIESLKPFFNPSLIERIYKYNKEIKNAYEGAI